MIQVQGLGKKFNNDKTSEWLFRDLTFEIKENETVVFMGASGTGKTTLLKIIGGLLNPDQGKIELHNEHLGMVFQKNALFDFLTAEENLLLPLTECMQQTQIDAKKEAQAFLEVVGLKDSAKLFPNELSGGMQKRLGVARALVIRPKILLYDDPTAGLDPITSKKIADLMIKLKKQYQSTVLIVTNDLKRATQLGDRIYLLANGKLFGGLEPNGFLLSNEPHIIQFVFGLRK
ncbi:MAG: ATP-binding cassette domain-containing protein [Bdellovibrio sp.]|nr:ATP-binding cassette domain-containing protein [Bdellovibrio sp.]